MQRSMVAFLWVMTLGFGLTGDPGASQAQSAPAAEAVAGDVADDVADAVSDRERLESYAEERRALLLEEYTVFTDQEARLADDAALEALDQLATVTYVNGTSGNDVIYYGRLAQASGGGYVVIGNGICVWAHDPSAPGGCRGAARYHQLHSGGYPMGIRGDGSGSAGFGEDRIYPAKWWPSGITHLDCPPGPGLNGVGTMFACDGNYVILPPSSDATFQICGDNCSVSQGTRDLLLGWQNRDTIYAGAGGVGGLGPWEVVVGEDPAGPTYGSDLLYGDDGDDRVWGSECVLGTEEQLIGGNGNDWLVGVCESPPTAGQIPCPRYFSGGPGNDQINAGRGSDVVSGGPGNDDGTNQAVETVPGRVWIQGWQGNDTMYGEDGVDFLRGGEGDDRISSANYTAPAIPEIIQGEDGLDDLVGDSVSSLTCHGGSPTNQPGDYCDPSPLCDTRISCEE